MNKEKETARFISSLAVLTILIVALSVSLVRAATLTVTNLNASGPGSLAQAVIDAASGDTITFSVSGTITIPGTGLVIPPKELTIAGPGPNLLTISSGNTNVTLSVLAGATATVSGVTITQGMTGSCGAGGGINNAGVLTLVNSIVAGNGACAGAGIATVNGGSTTVINSTITNNNASIRGGGILNGADSTTIIRGTFITGNSSGMGSAVQLDGGTVTISQSCITLNSGGTDVNRSSGTLTAENNWWGVVTGPNTGGETTNVIVTDFLTSPPPCGPDSDNDGIPDSEDVCPDTVIPESVPAVKLGVNRFALTNDDTTFDTTAPKGKGPQKSFTIEDTAGCSCKQIIEMLGLGEGHTRFGCSISAMEDWIAVVNP